MGSGDEGRSGGGGEGETHRLVVRGVAVVEDGAGAIQNEEALSLMLYCTLSVIATQIRASRGNHLHTDQCGVLRDDAAAATAELQM